MKAFLTRAAVGPLVAILAIVLLVAYCSTHGTRQVGEQSKPAKAASKKSVQTNIQDAEADHAAAAPVLESAHSNQAHGAAWADIATIHHAQATAAKPAADTSLRTLRRYLADHK